MQQRIADLEKLLPEHVVQLSTQSAQEMQERGDMGHPKEKGGAKEWANSCLVDFPGTSIKNSVLEGTSHRTAPVTVASEGLRSPLFCYDRASTLEVYIPTSYKDFLLLKVGGPDHPWLTVLICC